MVSAHEVLSKANSNRLQCLRAIQTEVRENSQSIDEEVYRGGVGAGALVGRQEDSRNSIAVSIPMHRHPISNLAIAGRLGFGWVAMQFTSYTWRLYRLRRRPHDEEIQLIGQQKLLGGC